MDNEKVIVIGLDGATWSLLKKLITENITPNIKSIIEKGVYGILKSTIPPITGPAWVSFATGKNPGKHGCYDFLIPFKSLAELHPISSTTIRTKTFYEILEEYGKNNILINLPVSTPPKTKGIVIADFLTLSKQLWFPYELVTEIPELKNYRLAPKGEWMVNRKIDKLIQDILEIENTRFEIAYKLLIKKKWDFFFLLFSGTDWIQHVVYNQLISKGGPALKIFIEIDKYIGKILNFVKREKFNLLIISDHGFASYKRTFRINDWLEKEGFLRMKVDEVNFKYSNSHHLDREMTKAKELGINIKIPRFVLKLVDFFPLIPYVYFKLKTFLNFNIKKPSLVPQWQQTFAYCTITGASNFSGIYINTYPRFKDGVVYSTNEYVKIKNSLIQKLKKLSFIDWAVDSKSIYWGHQVPLAPDIILKASNHVLDKTWNYPLKALRNEHHLDGIFMAYGHTFEQGKFLENLSILDIAPTILHMFGIPIPQDMDGRVLKEVFKKNSKYAKQKIVYQSYEKERIKEKIKRIKNKKI